MDSIYLIKVIIAFIFVISLLLMFYFLLRKYNIPGMLKKNGKISIEEVLYIDQKRKIVSIKRDDKTYILLLGNGEQVIDIISKN